MAFAPTGIPCDIRATRRIERRVTGFRCKAAPTPVYRPGEYSDLASAEVADSFKSRQLDLFHQFNGNWIGLVCRYGAVGGEIDTDRASSCDYANFRVNVNEKKWVGRKVPEEEAANIDHVDPYKEMDIVFRFGKAFCVPGVVGTNWVDDTDEDAPSAVEINFFSSDGLRRMLIVRYDVIEGARQLAGVTTAHMHDRDHASEPVQRTGDTLGDVADLLERPPTAACAFELYDGGGANANSVAEWRGPKERGLRGDLSRWVKVLKDGVFVSVPIFPRPGDVFVFGHCILPSATAQVIELDLGQNQRFSTCRTYVWGDHPISPPAQKYLLKVK